MAFPVSTLRTSTDGSESSVQNWVFRLAGTTTQVWVSQSQNAGSVGFLFHSIWVVPGQRQPTCHPDMVRPKEVMGEHYEIFTQCWFCDFSKPAGPLLALTMIQYLILPENGQIRTGTPTLAHLKMYNYAPPLFPKGFKVFVHMWNKT